MAIGLTDGTLLLFDCLKLTQKQKRTLDSEVTALTFSKNMLYVCTMNSVTLKINADNLDVDVLKFQNQKPCNIIRVNDAGHTIECQKQQWLVKDVIPLQKC